MAHRYLSDIMGDIVAGCIAIPIALAALIVAFGLPVMVFIALCKYVFGW